MRESNDVILLELATPRHTAWEAVVLPLNYARISMLSFSYSLFILLHVIDQDLVRQSTNGSTRREAFRPD